MEKKNNLNFVFKILALLKCVFVVYSHFLPKTCHNNHTSVKQ